MSLIHPLSKLPALARDDVRLPAVFISLLLSVWAVATNDIINGDGVLYVRAAEMLAHGDRAAAYELYPWPFYSWLISITSLITRLGAESAAQVVNALLDATTVAAFITIARHLGADRKTLLIAAFVILFHPYMNDSRPELIRDHGYWAFYLLSLLALIRFQQAAGLNRALGWGLAVSIAILFRIEGIALMALMPLVLLLDRQHKPATRLLHQGMLYLVPLALILGLAVWSSIVPTSVAEHTGRLFEPVTRLQDFWHELNIGVEQKAGIIRDEVLNRWSDEYAVPAVYSIILMIMIHRIIITLSPLYTILPMMRTFWARFNPAVGLRTILVWASLVNLLVVFVFLVPRLFLAGRFVMPFVITVLLGIPFVLASVHDQWLENRGKGGSFLRTWGYRLIAILLAFMTLDGLFDTPGKSQAYISKAGHWMQEHVATDSHIYINNQKISYYAGLPVHRDTTGRWPIDRAIVDNVNWRTFDYLALSLPEDSNDIILYLKSRVALEKQKEFTSPEGKQVVIFRVLNSRTPQP